VNKSSLATTAALCLSAAAWCAPTAAISPLGRRLAPNLTGLGDPDHVALTFDDGPDDRTTPQFLDILDRLNVRATFFVLGGRAAVSPGLLREIGSRGHELGVHGWDHRCVARRSPRGLAADLVRTQALITEVTARPPRWYRPPYGVATFPLLRISRRVGLSPVLWTDWAWDWTSRATPTSVARSATSRLAGGAVLLLHDAFAGQADPVAWRACLGALPLIVDQCRDRGLRVGPLADHGLRLEARKAESWPISAPGRTL
jgi:peptidoglycan/xylan/chitin deacetylase (PgdA/CDA1 family)